MMTMGTITSSRFMAGIRQEVEKTETALKLFSETLDEWLECQRQWMYLETIFAAPDIQAGCELSFTCPLCTLRNVY